MHSVQANVLINVITSGTKNNETCNGPYQFTVKNYLTANTSTEYSIVEYTIAAFFWVLLSSTFPRKTEIIENFLIADNLIR